MLSSTDTIPFCLFSGYECIEYPMKTIIYGILSTVLILGLILLSLVLNVNADQNEIMSPRKQMAAGVEAEDVKCKSGLVLMIRSTNGSAACVKSFTSTKLAEAGWGIIIDLSMEVENAVKPVKQPESDAEKMEGNVIEVKIKDGIGSKDR